MALAVQHHPFGVRKLLQLLFGFPYVKLRLFDLGIELYESLVVILKAFLIFLAALADAVAHYGYLVPGLLLGFPGNAYLLGQGLVVELVS